MTNTSLGVISSKSGDRDLLKPPTIKNLNREYIMKSYWKNRSKKNTNKNKKKKVSSPKVVERLDKFGRVSRFVNQVGSVPSTDTEMFGCEIVRDLPDYVNDFIKQIGYDVVIKVPLSNPEGLTGSGENGECHKNSHMMSLSLGGNRILGYSIQIMKDRNKLCFLMGHSVWNTPEGKTRCVTKHEQSKDLRDDLIMGDYLLFVPVGMNGIDREKKFWLDNFIIYESDDRFCLKYCKSGTTPLVVLENQTPYITMRKVLENKLENKGHIHTRWKRFHSNRDIIKTSHFGKVSLFTGRSLDYFRNKILNTYYPKVKV